MNYTKLFIDTWGWLTLRDRSETQHHVVKNLYQEFRENRGISYTTDYVFDETITLLFRSCLYTEMRHDGKRLIAINLSVFRQRLAPMSFIS